MKMENKKWVSDTITMEDVKSWNDGNIITIKAGTGMGKSQFIKTRLYAYAQKNNKKILMLIHRTNCVDQFKEEIEESKKSKGIDIMTYQYLEAVYKNNRTFDFDDYKYIVYDEYHYFMSDARFNKTTDILLEAILNRNDKIRIFMSATGDNMYKYITKFRKLETNDYKLPISFKFIDKLIFFNKEETLENFIELAIKNNQKAIFFIQSAKKAYELYRKYKDYCLFNCGKSDKHYKHVNEDKINYMLQDEQFEELILITTTCMDAGVNIKDKELKHIVCDVKDTETLIQCIGRKRLEDSRDKINLLIKNITNQQLGGIKTQLNKKREMAQYLKDNINYLSYIKCLLDIIEIDKMLDLNDFGYCRYLARKFGFYNMEDGYTYGVWEDEEKCNDLEAYLISIVGRKLLKNEQKELVEKIDVRVDGKQQKSYRKLNDGLDMINLPFIIIPKKSGSVRYWIVETMNR